MTQAPRGVVAVVPVKPLAQAKSRLQLPAGQRRALALAFALDTTAALRASPVVSGVVVVTSDADVARYIRGPGVRVVPDGATGLGRAVQLGAGMAAAWQPGAGVAVVPADLPCLREQDVTDVLARAGDTSGTFVPDRMRTGTTFVICPPGRPLVSAYGVGSAARHRALGLHPLDDAPLGARHDVDTLVDLHAAARLGTGRATTAVLDELRLSLVRTPSR